MNLSQNLRTAILAMMVSASPALAESLQLHVESGSITGITDFKSGTLILYVTAQSSDDLAKFTQRHIGKKVDVLVGEQLVASPIVRSPIYGPDVPITLPMTDAQRREMIAKLVDGSIILQIKTSDSQ